MQAQAKAHDVLRKARAVVAALDRKAAVVTSVAADAEDYSHTKLAGAVTELKTKVSEIETCLEV